MSNCPQYDQLAITGGEILKLLSQITTMLRDLFRSKRDPALRRLDTRLQWTATAIEIHQDTASALALLRVFPEA